MWRVPKGGGRAWPGFETTRRATRQRPASACVEGAEGPGGHGRASRSITPSEARVWRSRGRPGPKAPATPAAPQATRNANTRQPYRSEGPGRGAGGRRQGLAGLRDDAPSHTSATGLRLCGGCRRARRARAGFEIDHSERSSRVAISRAAGPKGTRNTSDATSSHAQEDRRPPAHTAARPAEHNARQPVRAAARSRN